MALRQIIYSSIFAAGLSNFIEYRLSICALTCVPNPSLNLPLAKRCKSQDVWASANGERANATVIFVPKDSVYVALRAKDNGKNGSFRASKVHTPS